MDVNEIKNMYSMKDIIAQYGFQVNRSNFIRCPFHAGDYHASMKIYKDHYHCFSCGAHGNIFDFVMAMDGCDFKSAYLKLGGTYKSKYEESFQIKLDRYRDFIRKEELDIKKKRVENERQLNNTLITLFRHYVRISEPFSDTWCDCYNALQLELYKHELLNKEEYK